jgi:hypothetical protein
MTQQAFDQIAERLNEAIAVATGEADPASWHKADDIDEKAIRNYHLLTASRIIYHIRNF